MGSFQQISVGFICLIAAFAFGNYMHNNPPEQHQAEIVNIAQTGVGNVQSRLQDNALNFFEKRPAAIHTMRSPNLAANSPTTPPVPPLSNANSVALPPPSQLKDPTPTNPVVGRQAVVPDFSQIMAEFKNTPIELGKMPQLTQEQRVKVLRPDSAVAQPQKRRSLKAMAEQFGPVIEERQFAANRSPIPTRYKGTLEVLSPEQSELPLGWTTQGAPRRPTEPAPSIREQAWFTEKDFESSVPKYSTNPRRFEEEMDYKPSDNFADLTQQKLVNKRIAFPPIAEPEPDRNEPFTEIEPQQKSYEIPADRPVRGRTRRPQRDLTERDPMPQYTDRDHTEPQNQHFPRATVGEVEFDVPPPVPPGYRPRREVQHRQTQRRESLPRTRDSNNRPVTASENAFRAHREANQPNFQAQRQSDPMEQYQRSEQSREQYHRAQYQPEQTRRPNDNRVRTLLPFGLNEDSQNELSKLARKTNERLQLNASEFRAHEVRQGETLQSLAQQYFGHADYYLDLYLANKHQMRNPGDVRRGMTLRIPVYE